MDGFADQGQWHGLVQCILRRPYPRAFLSGPVENLVNQRAAVAVALAQDAAGNFDQVGLEAASIPDGKSVSHLVVAHTEGVLHQMADFSDQLHVAVFDTVMDHLDVVAGTAIAQPLAAGNAVDLGGDRLKHVADRRPRRCRTARHQRWAVPSAVLAAGNTHADKVDPLDGQFAPAAVAVLIIRIASIDQDIAGIEQWQQLLDHRLDRLAGGNHQHDDPRMAKLADELQQAVGRRDGPALAMGSDEFCRDGGRAVVNAQAETLVAQIEREVAAHYPKANDADISCAHASLRRSSHSFMTGIALSG